SDIASSPTGSAAPGLEAFEIPDGSLHSTPTLHISAATVDRYVVTRRRAEVQLPGPRDLLFRISDHLQPLGQPAGGPRNGEEHGEHVHGQPHGLVDQPGVKVDVRVELSRDEVVVGECDSLQLEG